jgi:hypothetical protein
MTLHEVSSQKQFDDYYKSNNLLSVSEKIDYLKNAMKIRAMLFDKSETEEEILMGLEETALLGYWKASW